MTSKAEVIDHEKKRASIFSLRLVGLGEQRPAEVTSLSEYVWRITSGLG
jgi:hypothetical protein